MSHVYEGPLATYNSLTDRNLAGYFSNTRMRRHLRKAGLVNKRGELVSENQYRLNMARKEHKKHVKDMLAQAIVHKTLDMERTRQVEIRRKLEEIAKIELVRRVKDKNQRSDSYLLPLLSPRAKLPPPPSPIPTPPPPEEEEEEEEEEKSSRGRKGDEEILPYLSPRSSRSASRPETANQQRYRPQSAPSGKRYDDDIVYVDEHGRQLSPQGREEFRTTKARPQDIDSKHLYALDSAALRKYALQLSRIEQESMSPYLYSPVPTPPRSHRGNRVGSRPQIRSRPRTAEPQRSSSPREKKSAHSSEKSSERSYSVNSERETSPRGTPSRGLRNSHPRRPLNRPRVVEGSLMLHRQEPAMMHQGEVQTLCEITMKYHGPNLTLPRDQYDPTQNVTIDQQHCGGNTLAVFRENLKPGDTFSFISRRHRGYPFSLSIFVDGRVDSRVSTCCEYKHAKGVKLGGKMGHFSLLKVEGATPCYKCKLTSKASPRSLKRPPKAQKQPEQLREEVIVVDRRHVQELSSEVNEEEDEHVEIPVEDESTQQKNKYDTYIEPCNASEDNNVSKSAEKESPKQKEEVKDEVISPEEADEKYEDDFDDEEEEKKDEEKDIPESVSSKSSRSSSRSLSPSNHSLTSDEEEADRNAVSHFVYEDRKTKVVGLPADEDNRTEKTETDKDSVSDIRKVAGYSDEEEYPDGEKYSKEQNAATKVTPERETHITRRRSTSSSSSSSSSRSRSRTPERVIIAQSRSPNRSPSPPEKRKSPSPELKRKSPSPEPARRSPSPDRRSPSPVRRSSTSSASSTSSVHVSEPEEKEGTTEKVLLAKSREVNSLPSPQKPAPITRKDSVPVEFNYTSYSESIADSDVGKPIAEEEPVRPVSPLPEEFDYRKKYENSSPTLTKSFRKGSTSSSSSSDGGKKQFPTLTTNAKKDYSSSESEDERKGKLKTSDVKDTKDEKSNSDSDSSAAKKRTISKSVSKEKSGSSESDSENEKKRALKQKELMFSKTAKSSSSSSSGSSSESEKEKKVPSPPRKSPSPPVVTQSVRKSSSSSSSSSDSSGESETDTARSQGEKAKLSTLTEQKEEQQQKESVPVPSFETSKEVKKLSSSSSSSSGSSSESESEKEESKPPVKPPSPPEQRKTEPLVTNEDETPKPKVGEAKSVTSSSGSSSSSSDSSETETDRSEKPPVTKVPSPPPEPKPQPAVIEKVDKKPEPVQESKKDESSGSEDSSSDSDSSSSDSESEDEKDKKPEEKTNEKQTNSADGSSKKQTDLPISESDTDKKISIFTSDTDGENMHGGNDPDEVEAGGIGGTSYLSRIGVKPGNPVEGSIIPMFEGKTDIDLNSVALSNEQVSEISKYMLEKDDIKTFSLRNANLDCDKFENIVKALKTTRSNVQMVNLNLNKLNATSAKEIGELFVEKPTLQILLLHGNPVGDAGIKYITESLQDVHNAHLSHKDEENPPSYCQLQELDLGDTSMGDEGMEQVSTLLEANTSLKTLNLNGNTKITVTGWKRLGKALKRNTTLETLTLDFNKIGDDGVASLVSGLKDNQTLKVLELEEGSISDEGGRKLVELLKCNTTILDITVSPGNTISDKTRGEILNYLGLNKAAAQPKST